jgi:hypothetical protein
MLPGNAGRTRLRSAGASHSLAAVTVPSNVVNPIETDWPG